MLRVSKNEAGSFLIFAKELSQESPRFLPYNGASNMKGPHSPALTAIYLHVIITEEITPVKVKLTQPAQTYITERSMQNKGARG